MPDTDTDTDTDNEHPSLADAVSPLALTGMDAPLWLQNSTYPASLDRLLIASALETGVQGLSELAVTQRAAGANMSVDVAAGRAVVPVTDSPNQGSALVRSTAVNNLTVAGAPAAGTSRIDLVIARVYDASLIGGSINGWQLEVVTGTAASSPSAPALPASSIELARIAVASGQASVQTANITDRRAMSGIWRPYTPVWQGAINPPNVGPGGVVNGRYMTRGKVCMAQFKAAFGSTGVSGGNGILTWTLPVPANNVLNQPCVGAAVLYVPSTGVFSGVASIFDANRVGALFPAAKTDTNVNWWQAADGGGSTATGVPNVSPNYNVQGNGSIWISCIYEAA